MISKYVVYANVTKVTCHDDCRECFINYLKQEATE